MGRQAGAPDGGGGMNRSGIVAGALAGLVVAAGIGWVAGRQVRSPADAAARTAPPKPSLITVPVESRRLTADVVTRGAVGYGTPTEISLPVSNLKQQTGIVTVAPVSGTPLPEGAVALSISARPVFVLQGDKPAYRDMGVSSAGDDVRQLEAALARLGFDPGPQDGLFDAKTLAAAKAFYGRAGYDTFRNAVTADEVVFFPSMPARVQEALVKAGEAPSGPVMSITGSRLTVTGELTTDDAKLVKQGAAVTIEDTDQGVRAAGTVSQVASTPGTNGVDPQRYFLEVQPKDLPPALVGATVVLTIVVQSTEAEVLAVPLAALAAAADGTTRVEVELPGGATRFVTVRPGLVAKGVVQVTPVDGSLVAGDQVVVGIGASRRSTPSSATTAQPASAATSTTGGSRAP